MSNAVETPILSPKGTFPATVVEVIDKFKIVINRGKSHNIRKGETMLVYRLSENEIQDPETGESLGYLEIVKGNGKVIYIQEKMSIIESDQKRLRRSFISDIRTGMQQMPDFVEEEIPFDNPEIGDKVKPI